MEKYIPATYDAVVANLATSAKQEKPLGLQLTEGNTLAIALLCAQYEPEIAAKVSTLMMDAFKLFAQQLVPPAKKAASVATQMTELIRPAVEAAMRDDPAKPGVLSHSLICNLA